MTKVLTLRLPDDLHEHYRRRAFEERTTITALIIAALAPPPVTGPGRCDVCGAPRVRITTPGAIRLCAEHDRISDGSETFADRLARQSDDAIEGESGKRPNGTIRRSPVSGMEGEQ